MERKSKRKNRSKIPDAVNKLNIKASAIVLEEALKIETEFIYNYSDRKSWEVSMPARNGAVTTLKFLKFWFNLPEKVFFSAVTYLDQFLALMKVQSKYLSCLSVSCLNIAMTLYGFNVNPIELLFISQCKCTVRDMERMIVIVRKKLEPMNLDEHHTVFKFLKIYLNIFYVIAEQFNSDDLVGRMLQFDKLSMKLEIILSNGKCLKYRPSLVTLALIHTEIENFLSIEIPEKSNYYSSELFYLLAIMIELKWICKMNSSDYTRCLKIVKNILKTYNDQLKIQFCQKLSWRFSPTTYESVRNIQEYKPKLSVINE